MTMTKPRRHPSLAVTATNHPLRSHQTQSDELGAMGEENHGRDRSLDNRHCPDHLNSGSADQELHHQNRIGERSRGPPVLG
jgi:hypothetical protein